MTTNKIQTDEEILRSWKEKAFPEPPEGSCWPAAYCTDEDMLEAIRQARAAGREEQRKLIAESIEHRFASYKNGGNPSYLLGLNDALEICGGSVEAIRAQGEDTNDR